MHGEREYEISGKRLEGVEDMEIWRYGDMEIEHRGGYQDQGQTGLTYLCIVF